VGRGAYRSGDAAGIAAWNVYAPRAMHVRFVVVGDHAVSLPPECSSEILPQANVCSGLAQSP
jgi:hypothetical protein